MTRVHIDIQVNSTSAQLPSPEEIEKWASMAVGKHRQEAEISLLVVDTEEGTRLNRQWRNKEEPTNVLSFPSDLPEALKLPLLGDLVICAPVVEREAGEQKKSLTSHWAHMIVHGTLHLLGYDHIEDNQALEMENLETVIMQKLGFPDPYQECV
ncbi:MAG: rRNA maturation RNase YbeY [Endozoicomonas sp.]